MLNSPDEPADGDRNAAAACRQQSRTFLFKSREYLAAGDLHQAAEKGWGAAAWMAKSVAETQGWSYSKHDEFFSVMHRAEDLLGDQRIAGFLRTANRLHGFFYTRRTLLRPSVIGAGLDEMAELLDILQPLTE